MTKTFRIVFASGVVEYVGAVSPKAARSRVAHKGEIVLCNVVTN